MSYNLETQEEQDTALITHLIDAVKLSADKKLVLQQAWLRICSKQIELQEKHNRRTKILKLVQEALSQLRVDMKYLVFDLEATRRERDTLKELLDDRS